MKLSRLQDLRREYDALPAETRAAREAEAAAKSAETFKRLEQQLAPIRADLEALSPDERKRFVWEDVDHTPVHLLVGRRSAIYRAANAARPMISGALLGRARARAREFRPESRRGRTTAASRAGPLGDDPSDEDEDDVAALAARSSR